MINKIIIYLFVYLFIFTSNKILKKDFSSKNKIVSIITDLEILNTTIINNYKNKNLVIIFFNLNYVYIFKENIIGYKKFQFSYKYYLKNYKNVLKIFNLVIKKLKLYINLMYIYFFIVYNCIINILFFCIF